MSNKINFNIIFLDVPLQWREFVLHNKETFIFYNFIIIHRLDAYCALVLMYLAEWIDKEYI